MKISSYRVVFLAVWCSWGDCTCSLHNGSYIACSPLRVSGKFTVITIDDFMTWIVNPPHAVFSRTKRNYIEDTWGLGHSTYCKPTTFQLVTEERESDLVSNGGCLQQPHKLFPTLSSLLLFSWNQSGTYNTIHAYIHLWCHGWCSMIVHVDTSPLQPGCNYTPLIQPGCNYMLLIQPGCNYIHASLIIWLMEWSALCRYYAWFLGVLIFYMD